MANEEDLTEEVAVEQPEVEESPEVEEAPEVEDHQEVEEAPETVEVEEPTEDPEDSEPAPWYDTDDIERGAGYGLDPEAVKRLSGPEELDKYISLLKAFTAPKQEPKAAEPEPEPEEKPGLLDVQEFLDNGYSDRDKQVLEFVNSQAEQIRELEKKLDAINSREDQAEHDRFILQFDSIADTFDEELFGRTTDESGGYVRLGDSHHGNRERLYEAYTQTADRMITAAESRGLNPPSLKVILSEAYRNAFAGDIAKLEQKRKADQVAKQAMKRRPANSTAASRSPAKVTDDEVDEVAAILNSPEFQKAARKHGV